VDLKQELYIRELRVRGHGVRAIGRMLGVSASTVSRVLSKPPDREEILDLTSRMEMMENKVALLQEALYITHDAIGRVGPPYSHRMVDLFKRWPDDYFKRLHVAGKL
jgi:predicted transcriptional regulator